MNTIKNAKHSKKNLKLGLAFIAVLISLIALPFIAQGYSEKASADPLSPEECKVITDKTNGVEADLMSCYEAFGHAYNNEFNFVMLSEILGGDCILSGKYANSPQKVLDTFDKNASADNKDILLKQWNDYYAAINACNVFLEKYDKGDKTPQDNIPFVAEAFSLRGVCYFDLARLFENVPLVLKPNGYMSTQASVRDLYSQILSDLWFGTNNGPDYSYDQDGNRKTNRITKFAAGMYLARASMFYWSYYGKIDNLTITTPPDIPLRYPSEKTSLSKADTVYCLKNLIHNSGVRLAEQFPNDFASSTAYYRCTYGIRATAGDLDNLIGPTDPGCGCYSIDGHVFTVNYGCETLSEDNNWINKLGVYHTNQLVRGAGEGMISVSPKCAQEIHWHEVEKPENPYTDMRAKFGVSWLDNEVDESQVTWDKHIGEWENCTGVIMSKYCPLCYVDGTPANFTQPTVLLSYADALLMTTELTGDAMYLNQVQARSGVPQTPYSLEQIKFQSESDSMFEGVNYWNDLRWARAAQKFDNLQNNISVFNNGAWRNISGYNLANYNSKRFLPIPESVVAKYGYRQNAGW